LNIKKSSWFIVQTDNILYNIYCVDIYIILYMYIFKKQIKP